MLDANQHSMTLNLETLVAAMDEVLQEHHESNPKHSNPYEQQCYVASAALKKFFGRGVLTLYRTHDFKNQYHWWVETKDGKVIDMTAQQYELVGAPVPSRSEAYEKRQKQSYLGFASYRKRMEVLMNLLATKVAGMSADEFMNSDLYPVSI